MDASNFDLITQELLKQKQLMEQMLEENEELHRQLADLREGRGIFIEVHDKRFALLEEPSIVSAIPTPAPEPLLPQAPVVTSEAEFEITEAPTMEMAGMPLPPETAPVEEDEEEPVAPTFLEEAMIDEFAAASTSPMAVWSGPVKKQEVIDEEEKAALRRQLIGSYLLE